MAQCRFLLSAGFDTTANTLTYLCHLLAMHPDEQEILRHEVGHIDNINFDNVQNLTCLNNAIMETLRLFPHASMLVVTKMFSPYTSHLIHLCEYVHQKYFVRDGQKFERCTIIKNCKIS